jgi:hypothetical protein
VNIADVVAATTLERAKTLTGVAEDQGDKLKDRMLRAGKDEPPDQAAVESFIKAQSEAQKAVSLLMKVTQSIKNAARIASDEKLTNQANTFSREAGDLFDRVHMSEARYVIGDAAGAALTTRLDLIDAAADHAPDTRQPTPEQHQALLKAQAEVTAHTNAIASIRAVLLALDLPEPEFDTLRRIRGIEMRTIHLHLANADLPIWKPEPAWQPEHGFPPLAHGGRVNRIRFSPHPDDGYGLASACEDRYVWFWYHDGRPRGQFSGPNPVNDVAFSPDGKILATASAGSTVRLLRLGNPVKATAFDRHSDAITDVEFSRGGQLVVSASADRTVRVFNAGSLAQLYFTSPSLPAIVTSAVFHPGGNLVVSGCDDGGVRLHTLDPPAIRLMGKFDAPARSPEFSPDGQVVLAASGDKTARLWLIDEPGERARIEHQAPITHATFRPIKEENALNFVTTSTNGEVRLLQLDKTQFKGRDNILEPRHPGAALFAQWSADGRWLATVGGGEVLLWEWINASLTARLRITGLHPFTSRVEFSPDAKLLVTYGGDHLAYTWDLSQLPSKTP